MITILTGNVLDTLPTLPANSVQCCVTSPPYWGLRSYLPDGHADKGFELGSEATLQEYVANMVRVFAEVKRVLRDDGVLFLNIGDSYYNYRQGYEEQRKQSFAKHNGAVVHSSGKRGLKQDGLKQDGLKEKDLCGIPWRVAFALQEDGWWLRSEITWCKKAPMPESVTDRPTSATEKIFLLTKNSRYFYDAEAVKENFADERMGNPGVYKCGLSGNADKVLRNDTERLGNGWNQNGNATGRNQRNFWLLGPESYAGAHFATFPTEIPRRAILAGTSAYGACPTCGAPWERVVEKEANPMGINGGEHRETHRNGALGKRQRDAERENRIGQTATLGFAPTCTCGHEDTVPCVVLDPFTGSGTTGAVARTLGRDFIGCELNPEYVKLAEKRIGHAQPALFGL